MLTYQMSSTCSTKIVREVLHWILQVQPLHSMMVCSLFPITDSIVEDAIGRPRTLNGGRTYPTTLVAKYLWSRRTRSESLRLVLFCWLPCNSTWRVTVSHPVITLDHFINWWLAKPSQFQMPELLQSVVFSWAFLWAWLGTRVSITN